MPRLFVHPDDPPAAAEYHARRVEGDGSTMLSSADAAWTVASPITWGPDGYRTEFRALWTAEGLLVRFDCDDRRPWATITRRDGRLWEEEVVELFLDPAGTGRQYAEVEISPANVVCDLRVESPWPALSSDTAWDWVGLVSVVERHEHAGTEAWTALAWLPFDGLRTLSPAAGVCLPPAAGDRWRFNVFRIKRPHGPADPDREAIFAAWAVPDAPSFHVPAVFRDLVFAPGR